MKKEDKETRYFIDIDLKTRKIIDWDYDQRKNIVDKELKSPFHQRIFITKGQYHKFEQKLSEI